MSDDVLAPVMKALDAIEVKLQDFSTKAEAEAKSNGKVSIDTQAALDAIGIKQREFADEIVQLKQRQTAPGNEEKTETMGEQFTKSDGYKSFQSGSTNRVRLEVKNTVTTAIGNTFSQRRPDFIGGAFRNLTLESLLTTLPVTSNAVDYVKENVWTSSAAEVAEGAAKPESGITTTLMTDPIATVAHWIKISKQLAADSPALTAYINQRMVYGVNLKVENQIIAGTGVAPQISGLSKAGNFTAHGYTAAALGAVNAKLELIRRAIADCWAADYPADVIMLNPLDWALIELMKDSQNRYLVGDPSNANQPVLWGVPVVISNAIVADTFFVGALGMACTFYNREGVTVELSDSDSDNFTKNLITVRAERRCALAVERPAAIRYGDLTPA
jgi:HK97 family phage major capsid protein